jgi:phosphoribosylaminoimidazole carboxylase (NCAIR synthetase)
LLSFAQTVDTLVYMTHLVPSEIILDISKNISVPQQDMLLSLSQDLALKNAFLESLNITVPDYMTIVSAEGLKSAVENFDYPVLVRRNQTDWLEGASFIIESERDLDEVISHQFRGTYIVEPFFQEARELVLSAVKTRKEEVLPVGITELEYREDRLYQAVNPPQIEDEIGLQAFDIAKRTVDALDFQGLFSIEFYLHPNGVLEVKGLQPFTHPGVRYTIEAENISQYDAMIRAILDWPLPQIEHYKGSVMMLFYAEHKEKIYQEVFNHPEWLIKVYHEEDKKKPQGHILLLTEDTAETQTELNEIQLWE